MVPSPALGSTTGLAQLLWGTWLHMWHPPSHCPDASHTPYSRAWSRLSCNRQGDKEGGQNRGCPPAQQPGARASPTTTRASPWGRGGGKHDVLGRESGPAAEGRQGKAPREELGGQGEPFIAQGTWMGKRECPGKVSSHFGPCHTSGGASCPQQLGAGREGDDKHRAWPQHLPSRSIPSPLSGGTSTNQHSLHP